MGDREQPGCVFVAQLPMRPSLRDQSLRENLFFVVVFLALYHVETLAVRYRPAQCPVVLRLE